MPVCLTVERYGLVNASDNEAYLNVRINLGTGNPSVYRRKEELGAHRFSRESGAIASLVKPTCLIIDEIGRCTFDEENTNMFFDMVDRRYEKEGPKTMIFTSNKQPGAWGEYFTGQDDLLAALDRIFDNANVFDIKGNSYRGRACTTYAVEAGDNVTK